VITNLENIFLQCDILLNIRKSAE